jgi:hypothetical protein
MTISSGAIGRPKSFETTLARRTNLRRAGTTPLARSPTLSSTGQPKPSIRVSADANHSSPKCFDDWAQYNIQLILPEPRDAAVYDALFSSIRKHLL